MFLSSSLSAIVFPVPLPVMGCMILRRFFAEMYKLCFFDNLRRHRMYNKIISLRHTQHRLKTTHQIIPWMRKGSCDTGSIISDKFTSNCIQHSLELIKTWERLRKDDLLWAQALSIIRLYGLTIEVADTQLSDDLCNPV